MRFQLFDEILEFEKNKSIVGIKNVTLESGNLISLNNSFFYPSSLAIESLAQLGGWFICASRDFSLLVILGMVVDVTIYEDIRIGDRLTIKVNLLEMMEESSIVKGEIWKKKVCAIKIEKIVYGMFKIEEEKFNREQRKIFSSLLK